MFQISLFDAYNIHTLAVADEFNQPDSRIAETLFYLGKNTSIIENLSFRDVQQ